MTLFGRLQKSRLNRNDFIKVLKHASDFLNCVSELGTNKDRVCAGLSTAHDVWRAFIPLLAIAVELEPKKRGFISDEDWRNKARAFGTLFVSRYGSEEVTPYIHVFVYHVGYYIERYDSLEKFANYASESKHQINKKVLKRGTSGFGGRHTSFASSLQTQLLSKDLRNYMLYKPTSKIHKSTKVRNKKQWNQQMLQRMSETFDFIADL